MCTVSFYYRSDTIIVTSNRDEHVSRAAAEEPRKVITPAGWFYAPVDPLSNGTWFGADHTGSVLVLLNGAEKKHVPNPPYRESRGRILWQLLSRNRSLVLEWENINLEGVEPFTLIGCSQKYLIQFRWDGTKKSHQSKDMSTVHIWSSATLYSQDIANLRNQWLQQFIEDNSMKLDDELLFHFHSNTHADDPENGLVINRKNTMLTRSITQCVISKSSMTIKYLDVQSKQLKVTNQML